MSADIEHGYAIATRLRAEAALADRPGQMRRLENEADAVVALATELANLRGFVDDLAENGVRFDLNPTIDLNNMGRSYTAYLERIDTSVRERARMRQSPDTEPVEPKR